MIVEKKAFFLTWLSLVMTAIAAPIPGVKAQARDMRVRKKLVETGWDSPDSRRLLDNLEIMEKTPFDGVVIQLAGRTDEDKACHLRQAFANEKWQGRWFEQCVEDLRACKFKRFTDNFILVGANPGDVDWFDDAGWANIVEHWQIAAWIAKQSGCKGILFDPEPYTPPHAQFNYSTQPGRDRHSFDEYYGKVRQRGREVMEAVGKSYPDITIFCYFMNSIVSRAAGFAEPRRALATMSYGMLAAFVDGWLDAMPSSVTLVDGCESAYRFNSKEQYLEAATQIRGDCQQLVSPENRAKYRAQVQVSFGVYLDAYWNPKDSQWGNWYIDGLGGSRVDRLRENVSTALRVADEYVWIYGEKFRWWPTPNRSVREQSWPEALADCDRILRLARDPIDYARSRMAELADDAKLQNLACNGDFNSDTALDPDGRKQQWKQGRPPAGWQAWQEDKSKGVLSWDREADPQGKGAAKAFNVKHGCFLQEYGVQRGRLYAVKAMRRIQGQGSASILVRWKDAGDNWAAQAHDRLILCDAPEDSWQEIFGVAEVPEGAGRLVILLLVSQQQSTDDVVWFDNVGVYNLQ